MGDTLHQPGAVAHTLTVEAGRRAQRRSYPTSNSSSRPTRTPHGCSGRCRALCHAPSVFASTCPRTAVPRPFPLASQTRSVGALPHPQAWSGQPSTPPAPLSAPGATAAPAPTSDTGNVPVGSIVPDPGPSQATGRGQARKRPPAGGLPPVAASAAAGLDGGQQLCGERWAADPGVRRVVALLWTYGGLPLVVRAALARAGEEPRQGRIGWVSVGGCCGDAVGRAGGTVRAGGDIMASVWGPEVYTRKGSRHRGIRYVPVLW